MVDKRKEGLIPFIEKKAGFKFERVGAPQPADIARLAGARTCQARENITWRGGSPVLNSLKFEQPS